MAFESGLWGMRWRCAFLFSKKKNFGIVVVGVNHVVVVIVIVIVVVLLFSNPCCCCYRAQDAMGHVRYGIRGISG
ncbi:predicted protein [Plenodomus lingam JN3]|uniref:Predicted protein n=1 Tax=Leptosphaeria maculans (strain JN3 / isolate v23.1.3 / race Av1-4-5-6-7-8) TaxID=985895 RepID=E5A3B7_LEPMJ|nr:predicted protein [Plenodomus lingam JN3]CBX98130.1 predicted protein [Plenodomus lingam JN3]